MYLLTTAIWGIAISTVLVTAQDSSPFSLCRDAQCTDCPITAPSAQGYPQCDVYDTAEYFGGGGFNSSDSGGYLVYVTVPQPQSGCATILRNAVGNQEENCGVVEGAWTQYKQCYAFQATRESFMAQFACGSGDLMSVGVGQNPASDSADLGQSNNTRRWAKNPAEVRAVMNTTLLNKRSCDGAVWTVNGDRGGYTATAAAVQVVTSAVDGGQSGSTVTLSTTREASFSSTVMAGIDVEVFSAGASFTYEMSTSSSKQVTVPIAAGSVGELGFTVRCTMGTMTCSDGTSSSGEACSPQMTEGEDVAGTYAVISVA